MFLLELQLVIANRRRPERVPALNIHKHSSVNSRKEEKGQELQCYPSVSFNQQLLTCTSPRIHGSC